MGENLYTKEHRYGNPCQRESWDRIFGKIKIRICLPEGVKEVEYPRKGYEHGRDSDAKRDQRVEEEV